jgi:murein hydrolase activator
VTGEIVSRFGPVQSGNYKAFTFQSGIDIKVKRGEPVRSVFRGEVVFAEWLSGYGNLVIIDHGENYYTLYAHLQEVFKKTGDTADTGEVIATVGDTGSINEVSLHFQLRHHGKPVDPMKWFNKGA